MILDTLLDSEVPDLFKIRKPDLPVVFMLTKLSDLVVHRAGSFRKWQMFAKWKDTFKHFQVESHFTLSSTL